MPQFANGTDLPPLPKSSQTIWRAGSTVEASWAIYANHGGGYSYRICKKVAGQAETEACYQRTPLKFASNTTKIVYADNSRPPLTIPATTTDVGTYPPGSQWRKNPIPMCNCDIGVGCGQKEAEGAGTVALIASESPAATSSVDFFSTLSGGKTCKSVPKSQCGHTTGTNTCLACGADSSYDCEVCCPGLQKIEKGGYSWCQASQPGPSKQCSKENPSACFGIPYSKSYLSPGQSTPRCPTGLMFPSLWDDGYGQGHEGEFMFSMIDELLVPTNVEPGEYSLSWRWDCEQTPQVWNSCADVTIVAD